MAKIGLFYASETGNTRKVAKMIKRQFDDGVIDLFNVEKASSDDLNRYEALIIGTPTLGDGELPESLEQFLPVLESVDFTSKRVALFGLGDQEGYPEEFVDALGILFKKLKKRGVVPIGPWPTDGYEFEKSKAVVNDQFVGLVIDQDNQDDQTEERVEGWVEQIKEELLAAAAA